MAGTVVATVLQGSVKKVTFAWTSAAGGDADGATEAALDGMILGIATIPSGGGTAPTALYDITVVDADGHDVLLGAGANRSATVTEYVSTGLAGATRSALTLHVTNAGAAKAGVVILYIR